jgi:hypothetical protein
MKAEIVSSQLALFFSEGLDNPTDIWIKLKSTTIGNFLSKTILINQTPIDKNNPSFNFMPAVQVTSQDGSSSLTISRGRSDFFLNFDFGSSYEEKSESIINNFKDLVLCLHQSLKDQGVKIKRVGIVNNFFVEEKNADKKILKYFINDFVKIHGDEELNHAGVRLETFSKIDSFKMNNLTHINGAEVAQKNQKKDGIIVTRDLSTFTDIEYDLGWEEIEKILKGVTEKLNVGRITSIMDHE